MWAIVFAAALVGAAVIVFIGDGSVLEPVGILLVIAFALLFTIRATVTVERYGVRARLGLFGFPRRFIGMDQIRGAVVVNVRPIKDYRGWGDRAGKFTRAYVCRKGQAIRLQMDRGPDFVITIDGARRAADRINAFVEERGPLPARPKRARRTPVTKPWF
jgi:hypothetical protein